MVWGHFRFVDRGFYFVGRTETKFSGQDFNFVHYCNANFSYLSLGVVSLASAYKLSISEILKAPSTSLRLWIVGLSILKYDFVINLYPMLPYLFLIKLKLFKIFLRFVGLLLIECAPTHGIAVLLCYFFLDVSRFHLVWFGWVSLFLMAYQPF